MITAIIFSRDRAMQLDALLRSLPDALDPVYVIWRATNGDHDAAYDICAKGSARSFYPESEWGCVDLVQALLSDVHLPDSSDLACFLTDDSVFYRQPMIPSRLAHGVLCHSFRLGRNTTWCYPHARSQQLPVFRESGGEIDWEWQLADADFGYPGSLDGHVFRASHLRRAMSTCRDDANPNQIEDHLNRWVKARLASEFPLMTAEAESSLVGIPANRVNETHPNRYGETYTRSADELCERYLDGERIAIEKMDFSDVHGAHQEIPLEFE